MKPAKQAMKQRLVEQLAGRYDRDLVMAVTNALMAEIARLGGCARSPLKSAAARANGRKGGRPVIPPRPVAARGSAR